MFQVPSCHFFFPSFNLSTFHIHPAFENSKPPSHLISFSVFAAKITQFQNHGGLCSSGFCYELHPRPPISLHNKQVESLTEKLTFLQEFLESYNPHLGYSTEADPLESRIADAAYAAEDAIESHIVDQIASDLEKINAAHAAGDGEFYEALWDHIKNGGEKINSDVLYEALEMVIEDLALIQKEAVEIKRTTGVKHQLHTKSTPLDSLESSSIAQKSSSMVGADDMKLEMMDRLTADRLHLQVIPIVGMGGTGKTTLARNIYQERLIKEHFDICTWATISQEYSIREMLIEVLDQLNDEVGQQLSEGELGEMLYKHLYGRKYLIIMDDVWSIKAWDGFKRFLPDNKNGSRIVITTRLSNLASEIPDSNSLGVKLLDEADSWELLSKTVFGEKVCPLELEEIGKEIAKSCKGLPLSIVVVGGVLAKSKHTREFWENTEENLNSIVNLEDDERCLKILHMSYKQLPVYLKPCFLYMGVFREDEEISISKLIKLWVAEGFLKAASGKSLEEIARVYLKELIGRNLILIDELGSAGNIKYCKIHDLLRDLCLREAEKERFYTTTPQGIVNGQRRIVISRNEDIDALSSMSVVRSLICNIDGQQIQTPLSLRLLRILKSSAVSAEFLDNVNHLFNSRFLDFSIRQPWSFRRSILLFWNLQTLIVDLNYEYASLDIWNMPHVRHVQFKHGIGFPDPIDEDIVLGNLHTLKRVENFNCSEQVVKRIPNIKKLEISYDEEVDDSYGLNNLDKLEFLTSLTVGGINPSATVSLESLINFPHSLNKLSLHIDSSQCWQDILDKIGVLPLLQKLALERGSFEEEEWETSEGHFRSLKFLALRYCVGLQVWTTESSHFPCLERLVLNRVDDLEEVPLDFAEISTLRVIDMEYCSDSAVVSAKRILEEQEELHGEEAALQVKVRQFHHSYRALLRLESPNFLITFH